jgi:hypothetical protein
VVKKGKGVSTNKPFSLAELKFLVLFLAKHSAKGTGKNN